MREGVASKTPQQRLLKAQLRQYEKVGDEGGATDAASNRLPAASEDCVEVRGRRSVLRGGGSFKTDHSCVQTTAGVCSLPCQSHPLLQCRAISCVECRIREEKRRNDAGA